MAVSLSLPTAPARERATHTHKEAGRLGDARLVRYLIRVAYVAAAVLALVFLAYWASPVAEPLSTAADGAAQAFVAQPYVSSDPSLPSAASVFQGYTGEAVQQVDSF